jgi:hypothetical protein
MKSLFVKLAAMVLLCVAGVAALNGCGGDGTVGTGGTGTLNVHLADGGGTGITAMNISFDRVEANIDGHWQTLTESTQDFNLLDLRLNSVVIGSKVLPSGNYSQIRLHVTSATVTDATGTHTLVIPSGMQSGLKINVNFPINANDITDVLLDFNVADSVVIEGNGTYRLKPVIRGVVIVLSGTATGVVSNASGVVNGATVTATYTAGTNFPIGTVVNSTTTMADGQFKVWALLPGTYTFDFSYTNPSTNLVETATVTGVEITANQNTDIGPVLLQ